MITDNNSGKWISRLFILVPIFVVFVMLCTNLKAQDKNAIRLKPTEQILTVGSYLNFFPLNPAHFPLVTGYVHINTPAGLDGSLSTSAFSLTEDGVSQTITSVQPISSAGSSADIVFVFDETGSMGNEIAVMKSFASTFTTMISSNGIDARYALISFKDVEEMVQIFTSDALLFQNAVNYLVADGGGDLPEVSLDACMLAINGLTYRPGAQKIIILVTDAITHYLGDGSGFSDYTMTDVIIALLTNGITVFAAAPDFTAGKVILTNNSLKEVYPVVNSINDDVLRLAEETGGIWLDINSMDFTPILEEIVETIVNQWVMTYTTTNASADGSTRTVELTVNDPTAGVDTDQNEYVTPTSLVGSIKSESPVEEIAGNEFWVEIIVGDPNPVTDLFGLSFTLNYNTTYLDYVTAEEHPWFGGDLLFQAFPDDGNGKVDIGVTRKAPASGVHGSGGVARVKLVSSPGTPHNTNVDFIINNIIANDHVGNSITLVPIGSSTNIISGIIVWPGDTDNDGDADAADVLRIGLYYNNSTGPSRPGGSCIWAAQMCPANPPWIPANAVYADCNGDGIVNAADVLCIGLNYGNIHPSPKKVVSNRLLTSYDARLSLKVLETDENNETYLELVYEKEVEKTRNLLGISFTMKYEESIDEIEEVEIIESQLFGDDLITFKKQNDGLYHYAVSRKVSDRGIDGNVKIATVRIKSRNPDDQLGIKVEDIKAIDDEGNQLLVRSDTVSIVVGMENENIEITNYELKQNYPNPFNPSTTILFDIPARNNVIIEIYDIIGRKVKTLLNGPVNQGRNEIVWDGLNQAGEAVTTGNYFVIMRSDNFFDVIKINLIK
ncbi:VWA domain-containing protein [Bacteroidota bacterium]